MSRLTRDEVAKPVSRNKILRRVRGQGNIYFRCLAEHEQDRQPYPVDPYSAICDDHTYYLVHTNSGCEKREALKKWSMVDMKRQHPSLELPRGLLARCRRTLSTERDR